MQSYTILRHEWCLHWMWPARSGQWTLPGNSYKLWPFLGFLSLVSFPWFLTEAGVAQLVSVQPLVLDLHDQDLHVCFDFGLFCVGLALNTRGALIVWECKVRTFQRFIHEPLTGRITQVPPRFPSKILDLPFFTSFTLVAPTTEIPLINVFVLGLPVL